MWGAYILGAVHKFSYSLTYLLTYKLLKCFDIYIAATIDLNYGEHGGMSLPIIVWGQGLVNIGQLVTSFVLE